MVRSSVICPYTGATFELDDTAVFNHLVREIVTLTSTSTDTGNNGVTTMSNIVDKLQNPKVDKTLIPKEKQKRLLFSLQSHNN